MAEGAGCHTPFERLASRDGGRIAASGAGCSLSYAELERRATRLAHRLVSRGASRDAPVGVAATRAPDVLVAILAVLKAGAAYVPFDPDAPETAHAMFRHAGVSFVAWPGAGPCPILPGGVEPVTEPPDTDAAPLGTLPEIAGDDPAYILHTSGSTGAPKGVAMPHRALANLLAWHGTRFPPGARTLQFCALGFDVSFHEIFSALSFGGTLVFSDEATRRDPFALAGFVAKAGIETMFLPVAALLPWAEAAASAAAPARFRDIVTTGEALRVTPALREVCRRAGARLHNHYGATEFQDATALTLDGDPDAWPDLPGIGHAIAGVTIALLDEADHPVGTGATGEIHVGGAGLALGYHRRPDLTAARFRDHGGRRLFATGDLGRREADGTLHHLGRRDAQLKIDGVRIEPAEVEGVLCAHPAVAEAAVVARQIGTTMRLVGYVTPTEGSAPSDVALIRHCGEHLRIAAVPAAIVTLPTLPRTATGKIDRAALPMPDRLPRPLAAAPIPPSTPTERTISAVLRDVLHLDAIGVRDNFFEIGATSLGLVAIEARLRAALGAGPRPLDLFRHPTIERLARSVDCQGEGEGGARPRRPRRRRDAPIAIVGMAGRFPGAADLDAFWDDLIAGREAARPAGRRDKPGDDPRHVAAGAGLANVERFDAGFFDIPPREAALIDPQQRLLLECAVEALEIAGYGRPAPNTGVYVGTGFCNYLVNNVAPHLGLGAGDPLVEYDMRQFGAKLGNDRNYAAARIAYKLDCDGPALVVQTACSTALVAVHCACEAIRRAECAMALAGGLSLIVPDDRGYAYEEGMIRSPDGRCRPFAADAAGTFFASGGGLVVLKGLAEARADGDTIVAIIRGSAVNNDGALKVGFTAPSVERQAAVVETALARAGVEPGTISYVEAHGTGTRAGDPIEVAALAEAFARRAATPLPPARCPIGSLKGNIGHLDEAAGLAGLVKVALALRHGRLPPSLHGHETNPAIDFPRTPFRVIGAAEDWPRGPRPRRAGISAFGMGGTNCHMIVEEAPVPRRPVAKTERPIHVLALGARSAAALAALRGRWLAALAQTQQEALADLCFTAAVGRRPWEFRMAVAGATPAALQDALRAHPTVERTIAARRAVRIAIAGDCAVDPSAEAILLAHDAYRSARPEGGAASALVALLASWGLAPMPDLVAPEFRIGIGVGATGDVAITGTDIWAELGEGLAAFHRAGGDVDWAAFDRPWRRRRVPAPTYPFQRQRHWIGPPDPPVAREAKPAHPILGTRLDLAGDPRSRFEARVGGGDPDWLDDHRIFGRIVMPGVAFVEAMLAAIRAVGTADADLADVLIHRAMSWDDGGARRRLQTIVDWARATVEIHGEGERGGGWVLQASARIVPDAERSVSSLEVLRRSPGTPRAPAAIYDGERGRGIDLGPLFHVVETLWTGDGGCLARITMPPGTRLGAHAIHPVWLEAGFLALTLCYPPEVADRTFVPLGADRVTSASGAATPRWCHASLWPTTDRETDLLRGDIVFYADGGAPVARFDGVSLKIADAKAMLSPGRTAPAESGLVARAARWRETSRPPRGADATRWLAIAPETAAAALVRALEAEGHRIVVLPEEACAASDAIAEALRGGSFEGVLDARGFGVATPSDIAAAIVARTAAVSDLVRALARRPRPPRLWIVGTGVHVVEGSTVLLANAGLPGLVRVLAAEHPELRPRLIDLDPTASIESNAAHLADEIGASRDAPEAEIGWRGHRRFAARLERLPLPTRIGTPRFAPDRTWLVSGGTGGIGRRLVRHLLDHGARHVAVVARDGPPPEGSVLVRADVTDAAALGEAWREARRRHDLPPVAGIVHLAGILDDGILLHGEAARAARVIAPKVAGALALEALSSGWDLDHFILFGSISATFGTPGQGAYAAANSALEVIAARRRAAGLPGLAIAWPSWAGAGMSAGDAARRALGRHGEALLDPADGLVALDALMNAPDLPASVVVTLPSTVPASERRAAADVGDQTPPPDSSCATLRTHIEGILRDILGHREPIDPDAGFFALGLDSLGAIELRNRLQASLGRPLGGTLTFDHPTTNALAAALTGQVEPREEAPDRHSAAPIDYEALLERKLAAAEQSHG